MKCTCDDNCGDPCPVHAETNAMQDRLVEAHNEIARLKSLHRVAENYVGLALRTESDNYAVIHDRINDQVLRLIHAALGLANEAGEFAGAIKAFVFYGRELDLFNLEEELGDANWFEALGIDAISCLGHVTTLNTVLRKNIDKLRVRFQEKFSEQEANSRHLDVERIVLERNKLGD